MTGSDLRPWPQARLQCTNFYDPGSSERLEYLQSSTGSSSWASHLIYKESRSEIQAVDFWLLYCLDLTLDLAVCLKLNLFVKINSVYYWLSSCQHYFFWTSYWSLTIYQTSIFWSYQLSDLAVFVLKGRTFNERSRLLPFRQLYGVVTPFGAAQSDTWDFFKS